MQSSAVTAEPCPECGGRGWLVQADGGAGTAKRCSCQERDRVPRLLAAAGIPASYEHCKLSKFHTANEYSAQRAQLMNARAAAERYVEEFVQEGGVFRQSGLLFLGPPGVGKTHLAVGVLRELIERYGVEGRFVEFTALIHQIQSTFDPDSEESKRAILYPLMQAELLVLDELGTQKPTPWVQEILYLLINSRYTRRRPTLFTTNYRLELGRAAPAPKVAANSGLDRGRDAEPPREIERFALLSSRLSPMLVSRLYEMAQPVVLDALEDFRREHKVHGAHLR
jgi:DNA replication protein DnaC